MKFLFIIFIFYGSVFANSINESLLNIHATIVPKLPLMDYDFKDKLNNNSISIIIYYDNIDYSSAKKFKEKIDSKYAKGVKKYLVKTRLVPYTQKEVLKANIFYLLPSSKKNIVDTLKNASINSVLTFSYSSLALEDGCMISLEIGAKVKPIINLNAIKSNNISIRPVLLDISKIYGNRYNPDISSIFNIIYAV